MIQILKYFEIIVFLVYLNVYNCLKVLKYEILNSQNLINLKKTPYSNFKSRAVVKNYKKTLFKIKFFTNI